MSEQIPQEVDRPPPWFPEDYAIRCSFVDYGAMLKEKCESRQEKPIQATTETPKKKTFIGWRASCLGFSKQAE